MHINILAFGIVREIVGGNTITLDLPTGTDTDGLKAILIHQYPRLQQLRSFMLAINKSYVTTCTVITAADEIAVIPPVSGG